VAITIEPGEDVGASIAAAFQVRDANLILGLLGSAVAAMLGELATGQWVAANTIKSNGS
jgi:hypothetical protein